MKSAVTRVMDPRLGDMLARWRAAYRQEGLPAPLVHLAPHGDNLLLIAVEDAGYRYLHYGKAFVDHFGVDLTGRVITSLAPEILPPERRGMLEFDYTFVQSRRSPLWRSYTADFGDDGIETWQRLVLPAGDNLLAVGAYAVPAKVPEGAADALLRLVIERVPVVLDPDGGLCDMALSLRDYSDTQRHAAELEVLANHDALTGTANLRHFHRLASLELGHARRMNRSLALLALDLDHFKRINDQWGHAAGDLALKSFAATCRAALREPDILGRCGGEEFAIALPNTGMDGAMVIAERLRRAVESLSVPQPEGPPLSFTVSIGIAVAGPGQQAVADIAALLAHADRALYASKKAGRNRVSIAGD
ncbi:MAG TPA: GGDEF domain-containing protein [Magnetospirillum sp.]|nr:GGDEF domain-containing protein [Magnetospirillum sp.]